MRPPPGGFKTAVFGWVAERLNAPRVRVPALRSIYRVAHRCPTVPGHVL